MREDIETVIDRLLEFVRQNGRVKLQDAASALALSKDQAERLALLLEQSKLLEVEYSLSGTYLSAPTPPSGGAPRKPGTGGGEPPSVPVEKASNSEVLEEVSRLEREMLSSENLLHFFERDLARRTLLVESLLTDLEKRSAYTEDELAAAQNEVHLAQLQLESFSSEIAKLSSREVKLKERLALLSSRLASLSPSAAAASSSSPSRNPLARLLAELKRILARVHMAVKARLLRQGVFITPRIQGAPLFPPAPPIPQVPIEKRLLPPLSVSHHRRRRQASRALSILRPPQALLGQSPSSSPQSTDGKKKPMKKLRAVA